MMAGIFRQMLCSQGTTCSEYPMEKGFVWYETLGVSVRAYIFLVLFSLLIVLDLKFYSVWRFYAFGFILLFVGLFIYFTFWLRLFFYNLEEDHIKIVSGVFGRGAELIPYHKIQNLAVRQSFLARIFGVASVLIATADKSGATYINGLTPENATRLRDLIQERVRQAKGETGV